MGKSGVSWVKALSDYAKTLNLDPREEPSWKSAFEVCYGRKININEYTTSYDNPVEEEWAMADRRYTDMTQPRPNNYTSREKDVKIKKK